MSAAELIKFLQLHPEAKITFREPYDKGVDLEVTEAIYDGDGSDL
jgi:hypothetical protein